MTPRRLCQTLTVLGLACCLAAAGRAAGAVVHVHNPLGAVRHELVSVAWRDLVRAEPGLKPDAVAVYAERRKEPLVSQVIDLDHDGAPEEIVFAAEFVAGEVRTFNVRPTDRPMMAAPQVTSERVHDHMDDFAWENDRIGFRLYGPADKVVSSAVDIWCKRTRRLVVGEWYRHGDYHHDHGEGLDSYTVGATRGAGGIAIVRGDRMFTSRNFVDSRVLADGPLRLVFEVDYPAWDAAGVSVRETKRITLDAGENMNRFESTFTCTPDVPELRAAIGLARRGGDMRIERNAGWVRGWAAADLKTAGMIGVGLVLDPRTIAGVQNDERQTFVLVDTPATRRIAYYAGAGWNQSGDFANVGEWDKYLEAFVARLRAPLQVSISRS